MLWIFITSFLKDFVYLFLKREEGSEKEKHQCVAASRTPALGTWPTTRACALTGNWTSNPLFYRPVLNPLSHTSQGYYFPFYTCLLPSTSVDEKWQTLSLWLFCVSSVFSLWLSKISLSLGFFSFTFTCICVLHVLIFLWGIYWSF